MTELQIFTKLKAELLRAFCEANPHWQGGLKDFGVREIAAFQNILQEKTGGRVSEKWFYTHLKKDHDRLPRIDVLDLLSEFVGFDNWGAFKSTASSEQIVFGKKEKLKNWKVVVFAAVGVLAFFTLWLTIYELTSAAEKEYEICFVDAMTNEQISDAKIKIKHLREEESPEIFEADENSCHAFRTEGEKITFEIQADYYRTDTITRFLRKRKQNETITMTRDDYAWMIHIFSSGKMTEWEKRREHLNQMIADDAIIFQVDVESGRAMGLFNKPEFISKLTLPVSSLGELEILQTRYDEAGKIESMHFYQKRK